MVCPLSIALVLVLSPAPVAPLCTTLRQSSDLSLLRSHSMSTCVQHDGCNPSPPLQCIHTSQRKFLVTGSLRSHRETQVTAKGPTRTKDPSKERLHMWGNPCCNATTWRAAPRVNSADNEAAVGGSMCQR